MARLDLQRLRKTLNMTQRDLAAALKLSQGFLSSVENGRNPFPDERIDDLQKIFPNENLEDYQITAPHKPETTIGSDNMFSSININDPETLRALLAYATRQTKQEEVFVESNNANSKEYQDRLLRLSDELEKVRKERYELLEENLRMKDLLRRNGIDYSNIKAIK